MAVEQSVEWLAGETEVLAGYLSQCHFVDHWSHMTWPVVESGPPMWEAGWEVCYVCTSFFLRVSLYLFCVWCA
jgi:hypothetical protein